VRELKPLKLLKNLKKYNIYMPQHTDLIFVYELTNQALKNIKDLEEKMKIYENTTRKKITKKKRKTRKKYNI
tara:strand:+ start:685 stop:900 length:216 start_codon:yes stop_codon:yes gene_type:complete